MKKFILLFFLFSIFSFSAFDFEVDYGPKFLSPTEEVITPHIKWIKPYTKGPIKVLFITYRWAGGMREVIELAQRMDLDYTVFALETSITFWEKNQYAPTTISQEDSEKELEEKLKGSYDLIIIGNINWSVLPLRFRYEILKKVKDGTSLLGVISGADDYLKRATEKKVSYDISFLFPYKGLPCFSQYKGFDSFLSSTLDISEFGKGKIFLIKGYEVPRLQALTPGISGDLLEAKVIDYDYYLAYICHLILFASGKAPDLNIKGRDYINEDRKNISSIEFFLDSKDRKDVICFFTLRNKDNEIFSNQEKKVSLFPGENKIKFDIGKVPCGNYFADLWVKDKDKTINFGSCFLDISSDTFINEINIKKSYKKEEEVSGKINIFTKKGENNLKLKITQRDYFGRITNKKTIPLKEDVFTKGVSFSLSPTTPLSIIQYLDIELIKENEVLDKKRVIFSISNLYPKDDIRYIGFTLPYGHSYLFYHLLSELYKAGFDTLYLYGGEFWTFSNYHYYSSWERPLAIKMAIGETLPLSNLYYLPFSTKIIDEKTDRVIRRKKDDHIRVPCLTNPEYLKNEKEKLTKVAENFKHFSTLEFSIGDEICLVQGGDFELCFSPTCISKFHQFLREEYGSIENLNKEYESNYTSFDEVKPVTLDEVKKNPKLIPLWVDYRIHMENTWAGIYSFARDTIHKIVPGARIGSTGSESFPAINSFQGVDFYKLIPIKGFDYPYDRPFPTHARYHFAQPGTLLGFWYGGYNGCRNIPFQRGRSWRDLFRGANSFCVWHVVPGGEGGIAAPDFSFYDFFKANIKEVREIKNGIGKLLMNTKKENDKIAVLYSASSVHCATLTPDFPSMENVLNSLCVLFDDTGYQFQVISYKQLEEGILNEFEFLFLPFCQSISKKQAEEIISFVNKGGVVIADLRPGVCDEHGKPYEKGVLDEIFGIKQNTKNPQAKRGEISINDINFPEKIPDTYIDTSLKLTSGKAKAFVGETPVLIFNNYGKGRTILLNFSLYRYVKQLRCNEDSGEWVELYEDAPIIRNFFKSLLSFAGVKEKLKITPEIPGLRTYRFYCGNLKYLGILQELPEPAINYSKGKGKPLSSSSITISLSDKYHIYNIRSGEYLGYSDKIKTNIEPAKAELYSLLPYKVKEIKINIPEYVNQGDKLGYEAEIKVEGGKPYLHIFRVSLISPQGKEIEYYSENLKAEGGKVKGNISLSLNENPGEYKIRIKDIASGKIEEKTFKIKEKKWEE